MQVQRVGNQPAFGSTVTLEASLVKAINKQKNSNNRNALLEIVEKLKADEFGENRHYNFGAVLADNEGRGFFNANLAEYTKRLTVQVLEKFEHLGKSLIAKTDKENTNIAIKHLSVDEKELSTKISAMDTWLDQAKTSEIKAFEKVTNEYNALKEADKTKSQINALAQK